MSQFYSDPDREDDPYSLPDVEIWQDHISIVRSSCGDFEVGADSEAARGFCPSCGKATCVDEVERTDRQGWFYWFCLPGCLPDSEPYGPYATEQDAERAAREHGE